MKRETIKKQKGNWHFLSGERLLSRLLSRLLFRLLVSIRYILRATFVPRLFRILTHIHYILRATFVPHLFPTAHPVLSWLDCSGRGFVAKVGFAVAGGDICWRVWRRPRLKEFSSDTSAGPGSTLIMTQVSVDFARQQDPIDNDFNPCCSLKNSSSCPSVHPLVGLPSVDVHDWCIQVVGAS